MSVDLSPLLNMTSPGPIGRAYLDAFPTVVDPDDPAGGNTAGVVLISGPVGSAKTRTTFNKCLRLSLTMPKDKLGWRLFRLITLRDNYPNLWRTTIGTWQKIFPENVYPGWTGTKNRPAEHILDFTGLPDGSKLHFESLFLAPGEETDLEAFCAGLEATVIYLNEVATFTDPQIISWTRQRTGRFPDIKDLMGPIPWWGVLGDFNKPDPDHWLFDYVKPAERPGFRHFDQPGGDTPEAENLRFIIGGRGYYRAALMDEKTTEDYKNRMIRNKWGFVKHGLPVYQDHYSDERHVAKFPIKANPQYPLIIGSDGGRKPALVVMQLLDNGRWVWLAELWAIRMSAGGFGAALNILLATKFPSWPKHRIIAWADPTTADMRGEASDAIWQDEMRKVTALNWRSAPSNDPLLRIEVIDEALKTNATDGGPGLLICPTLMRARAAMASKYRYSTPKVGGIATRSREPDKNDWSHLIEGAQYGMLGGGGYELLMTRARGAKRKEPSRAITDFNPLEVA